MKRFFSIMSIVLLSACASQKPSDVKMDVYTKSLSPAQAYLLLAVYYAEEVKPDSNKLTELFDKKASELCTNGFSFGRSKSNHVEKLDLNELIPWIAEKHRKFVSSHRRFDKTSSSQKIVTCNPA